MTLTNKARTLLPIAVIGCAALIAGLTLTFALAAGAATRATTVTVTAGKPTEFGFRLSTKTVKHGAVTFKVTNSGSIPHDFKICSSPKGGTRERVHGQGDEAAQRRLIRNADLHVREGGHVRVPLRRSRSCRCRHEGRPEGDVISAQVAQCRLRSPWVKGTRRRREQENVPTHD